MLPAGAIEPIPYALSVYAAFIAFRYYKTFHALFGAFFISTSIVIDVLVFTILIWGLHIQFNAPPAFYLKTSVPFFGFIIALRSLRFQAKWVLLTGSLLALSWAVLSYLAAYPITGYGNGLITWDYREYMQSLSVNPAVEIEKITAIIVTTIILALSVLKSRMVLIRATKDGAAAKDLSLFFDKEVVSRITQSENKPGSGYGEIRDAAILFVDLRNFTKNSTTMTPNDVLALLGEYQSLIVPIIQKHGGVIDKFLGDGIMASFGAAIPSKTYTADCLDAVSAIHEAVLQWRAQRVKNAAYAPLVGMAASHGKVVFGVIGSADRLEFTVIGDAVNLAAKLEKHTKAEMVSALTTLSMMESALSQGHKPAGHYTTLKDRCVEGIKQPLDIVTLFPQETA